MAFDGGIGVGFFDEGTRTAYHYLFQQIEEGYATFLLLVDSPGNLEVSIEITNTCGRKVTTISASEEIDLIVQVKDSVVNGSSLKPHDVFTLIVDLNPLLVGDH